MAAMFCSGGVHQLLLDENTHTCALLNLLPFLEEKPHRERDNRKKKGEKYNRDKLPNIPSILCR